MTVLYAAHSLRKLDRHGAELVRKKFQKRSIQGPLSLRDAREGCRGDGRQKEQLDQRAPLGSEAGKAARPR